MSLEENRGIPGEINYDYQLLHRVKRELQHETPGIHDYDIDIRFSGEDTPQVLFHGFSTSDATLKTFQGNRLNQGGKLLWFSEDPKNLHIYGMTIKDEVEKALNEAGLTHHGEKDHPDMIAAGPILDAHKYMMVLFPHIDTDLGKWIINRSGTWNTIAPEYITDTDIPLDQLTIVRSDQVSSLIDKRYLQPAKIHFGAKEELRSALNITDAQQEALRGRLTEEMQRRIKH